MPPLPFFFIFVTGIVGVSRLGLTYAQRMGQPTQRATNYTARSNIDTAQIFLHVNGQRPNRAMIRQRSRRRQRRGEPHTEHGLGENRSQRLRVNPSFLFGSGTVTDACSADANSVGREQRTASRTKNRAPPSIVVK